MHYGTERGVFALTAPGLALVEVAPGIDVERDILARMGFAPIVDGTPRLMDPRIFRPEPMDLRNDLIAVPLAERFSYDAQQNTFFINFERLSIRSLADVEAIRTSSRRASRRSAATCMRSSTTRTSTSRRS